MKYIEADKIKSEIDKIIEGLKRSCNPNPLGTTEEMLAAAEIEALVLVKDTIDKMKQEDPTPLNLLHCHELCEQMTTEEIESIFVGKPTDPDILTVVTKNGTRHFCDEVKFG